MSLSVTLADANILISRTLRDHFVYAAKAGALEIHWSDSILDEAARNLTDKFGFTTKDAAVLVEDAGTMLQRLAAEYPEWLRQAHRLVIKHSPRTEHEVLATLERIVGAAPAHVVRAVVTAG